MYPKAPDSRTRGCAGWRSLVPRSRSPPKSRQHSPAFLNQALSGTLTLNGNGTGSNDYTVTTGGSPQTTFHFKAYIANPNLILLVDADDTHTIAGSVSFQP